MSADDILDRLDPEQREAASAPPGPVCILAGAGTGKTRTITHRIAYGALTGAMPPGQVLAVTFTTRAAGELRGRLRELGAPAVQARTFHAAALRQLTYFAPRVLGGPAPRVAESKAALVAEAAGRRRLAPSRPELADLITEIEWAAARLVTARDYPAAAAADGRELVRPATVVAQLMEDYTAVKERRGVMDFDDLLLLTAAAIEEHADVAAELRARYRHFVVDEYQDVTPLQERVLAAWVGERDSLTVVGDAAQTIYSFAGADPDLLLSFPRRHPGATVVKLVRDYRSTPQVVAVANRILDGGGTERIRLRAMRPDGPPVATFEAADEPAEAREVAARIAALRATGVPASEIAILFRVNAASEAYEEALTDAAIPYLVRGGERFFDRPEVREAMVLVRGAARSTDGARPAGEAVGEVLRAAGFEAEPPAGGAARERWENMAALARLADGVGTLAEFAALLAERSAAAHVPTVEGVTLASLHAAKGLEWEAVFLVGLVEGTVPIVHASSPAQLAEERRLLYVGTTRARRQLTLSWALARSPGGRTGRPRSRFLAGLLPAAPGGSARPRPAGSARADGRRRRGLPRCRVCGRALAGGAERALGRCAGCPAELDRALFARLREWRAGVARGLDLPAFCVFTDATLTAIAETSPRSRADLAAVPGVGPGKLTRWADEVLAVCAGGRPVESPG